MNEDNIQMAERMSLILMSLLVIILAFYLLFDNQPVRNYICIVSIVIMTGIYIISRRMMADQSGYLRMRTDLLLNALSFACFCVGIYLGTFAAGDEMAVAPVWMFFFAILIFNRMPPQNLVVISLAMAVFAVCSHITKSAGIFRYDMMHAITSSIASLSMSWGKSKMKVENILAMEALENANLEIMETVEEQEREARLLRHKASHDELSGFYKKNVFEDKVREILYASDCNAGHALACIDVDNFKNVNDTLGHLFGDKVLKHISSFLEEQAGEDALLCRFGGDEFCIFFPYAESGQKVEDCMNHILDKARIKYHQGDASVNVYLSIGVALVKGSGISYPELFQKADEALYRSKNEGKNTCRFTS